MASVETEFSPIVLMIDNETLALGPNAYVTQIGYCVADVLSRQYLLKPRAVNVQVAQPGRTIDIDTVRWWMNQPKEVQQSVFDGSQAYEPKVVFDIFQQICAEHKGLTVWASPAMFDLPQLTTLFGGKPWKYNQERCMMTLYKMVDPWGVLAPPENEYHHDAAADAGWQMEYLFRLVERLQFLGGSWLDALLGEKPVDRPSIGA